MMAIRVRRLEKAAAELIIELLPLSNGEETILEEQRAVWSETDPEAGDAESPQRR